MHATSKPRLPRVVLTTLVSLTPIAALAASPEVLELYVDGVTKQIFSEPGAGRIKLGTFRMEDEEAIAKEAPAPEARPVVAANAAVNAGAKGFEIKSADGQFTMKVGGRMHADFASQSNDGNLLMRGTTTRADSVSGTELRRARISLSGAAYKDFSYIIEGDFAGDQVGLRDVFLNYQGIDPVEITIGHQKHAMSMEIQESSNDIMFNERSLLVALTTPHFDRAIGINLKGSGERWSLQGGIYGDSVPASGDDKDEGSGWAVRGTYSPLLANDRVIHLGANFGQRNTNDNKTLSNGRAPRFRYETNNNSNLFLSDTGNIASLDQTSLAIVEAAAMVGRWSVQSEYGRATVERDIGSSAHFSAWYVQTGWTLTGESRTYKASDGEFKRLKPRRNFDPAKGQWGAWELALRLDHLDLEDDGILGGEQDRVSLNLNWYMNEVVRLLAGYSRAFDAARGPITTANGDDPTHIDVFSLRTQWAF